jgi:predicted dehydrogenase
LTEPTATPGANRRDFLTTSAATVAGLATLSGLAPSVHAAGGDTLRIGLIGCGGRGTGAAINALRADANVKLVALGDAFKDRWEYSLAQLRAVEDIAARIDVKPERCFQGLDAYKQVLGCGVDVVLLCTPPGFRPQHLRAAVDAGKHIFCEKPMAVDAPGVRAVLEACRDAKKKSLSVVSGFCYRYERAKRETMRRVHEGQVGDIVALHCTYNAGPVKNHPRKPGWSDLEATIRNWYYYTWLSGDHIVEQHCHSIDKMAWAMRDQPPLKAVGTGGRQVRSGPDFGHIFDHHAVVFEYRNGVKLFSFCRQQDHTAKEVSDYVLGTTGTADIMKHRITGKKPWQHRRRRDTRDDMYQNEHDELFASIRKAAPINDGEWMAQSTLMAIMGRMATYTGQVITWDMARNSREELMPKGLAWDMKLDIPPVAMPGVTRYS